ncbi:probable acylpyruvase FAHD1, mitochondrial [Pyrus x bretschneideri]|uniref:probable acylpyruvase FAHD1, mitochondrial n=1 Tax=Pyrus x bretschneideri TaxID=225117 RepID=UPI0020306A66|nr:probable acylpyruvase FAHD1, mitochondrial [Pyrus x bretschneideri]
MNGGTIEVPHPLLSLDHEVAVIMSQKARDVPQSTAMDYVAGYALALDMTASEIQASAKRLEREKGQRKAMVTLERWFKSLLDLCFLCV